jgi:hypothetical protein
LPGRGAVFLDVDQGLSGDVVGRPHSPPNAGPVVHAPNDGVRQAVVPDLSSLAAELADEVVDGQDLLVVGTNLGCIVFSLLRPPFWLGQRPLSSLRKFPSADGIDIPEPAGYELPVRGGLLVWSNSVRLR